MSKNPCVLGILGAVCASMLWGVELKYARADEKASSGGFVVSSKLQKCISLCVDSRVGEHKVVHLPDDAGSTIGYQRVLIDDKFLVSLSVDGTEVYAFSRLKYNPDGSEDRPELLDAISWSDAFRLLEPWLEICELSKDCKEYYRSRTAGADEPTAAEDVWKFMSDDFSQEGILCRNSRFEAVVGSRSRRLLSLSYTPCLAIPKTNATISGTESGSIVLRWLESDGNGILSATQSEVCSNGPFVITKVVAYSRKSVGFGTSQEGNCATLCWEVPVRYSMSSYKDPFMMWVWVRADTGDIFGGTLVPPVEIMREFVRCSK